MDDEPMWAADRIVVPTPGSAITIPETANEFDIKGSSNSDTDKIMARMDGMTMKMDAQYKEFQSLSKQPNPNYNDDDRPMSREEEAKFMQTFRLSATGTKLQLLKGYNCSKIKTAKKIKIDWRSRILT
ncbi:hypothetical protein Tco_1167083 [Tanacetum coccineum]